MARPRITVDMPSEEATLLWLRVMPQGLRSKCAGQMMEAFARHVEGLDDEERVELWGQAFAGRLRVVFPRGDIDAEDSS